MNFVNLSKTLAFEHQERFSRQPVRSTPEIRPSKSSGIFAKSMQFTKLESILKRDIGLGIENLRVHKFASYENIEYREGSLIVLNNRIYEIMNILSINFNVFFVCELFKASSYDDFCNSLVIEKDNGCIIAFNFNSLQSKLVYDKYYAGNKYFIIANDHKTNKLRTIFLRVIRFSFYF